VPSREGTPYPDMERKQPYEFAGPPRVRSPERHIAGGPDPSDRWCPDEFAAPDFRAGRSSSGRFVSPVVSFLAT
jgi:hypothetical protein